MIKGMIFDLDGTLIDSMRVWEQIDIDFLGKRGLTVPPDYLEQITPMGFLNAAQYTISRFGFSESPEEVEQEWMAMAEYAYSHTIQMKPGAKAFLKQCQKLGMKMAVATSSKESLYQPCLKHHNIAHMFQAAVTTLQAGEDKHSPKIYEMAAGRLGLLPSECIVFEDILLGVQTAHNAGFLTAAVYEEASAKDTDALRSLADFYLDSFEHVTPEDLL